MSKRNEISLAAHAIERMARAAANGAYSGTPESELAETRMFNLMHEARDLNNDCCESRHRVKWLRERLKELQKKAAQ